MHFVTLCDFVRLHGARMIIQEYVHTAFMFEDTKHTSPLFHTAWLVLNAKSLHP